MFLEVPSSSLSPEAIRGVVEEFVTREGTDYGHSDHTLEQKIQSVFRQLERGEVAIVFDPKSQTCNILTRDAIVGAARAAEAKD